MATKTRRQDTSRSVTERGGPWQARVTGPMLNRVLAEWQDHDGACAPSDHESDRDRRACARGEHR